MYQVRVNWINEDNPLEFICEEIFFGTQDDEDITSVMCFGKREQEQPVFQYVIPMSSIQYVELDEIQGVH